MSAHCLGASRSLTVSGDARERGRKQGLACAAEYGNAASSIGSLVVEPRYTGRVLHERLSQAGLLAAGAFYLARQRRVLVGHERGKYWAAYEGLAAGAGLSLPLMYGLGAVPEIVGAKMSFTLGCTSLALSAERTDDGGAQIAYNHDFPPRFGRYSFVRRNHPNDGYRSVCLTYPIMIGCLAGVNEHGLAVTLNHAFCTDLAAGNGLLLTTLVQDCLDRCATVDDALALFGAAKVTNGAILTVVDASGRRAAIERSCTRHRVREAVGESNLVTFNQYQVPAMRAVEVPPNAVSTGLFPGIPLHESNVERARRYELIERELPERLTLSDIRSVMTDHRGGEGDSNTICRHGDPLSETLWGAVISSRQRTLRVVFGHACSGPPVEYGIDAALVSTVPPERTTLSSP